MRKLGFLRVKKNECGTSICKRKFCIPKLNFNASDYTDMIDWQIELLHTLPPLLMDIPINELEILIESGKVIDRLDKYPIHTQAVERSVKMVTEASTSDVDSDQRDGYILNKRASKRMLPKYKSKSEFIDQLRHEII